MSTIATRWVHLSGLLLRFVAYFFLTLGLAVTIAAGTALAIDLAQFRYAAI